MKKRFKTSLDSYAIMVTLIAVSIPCILSAELLFRRPQHEEFWILLMCNILAIIAVISAFMKMPLSVTVTDKGILIKRIYRSFLIPEADILSVTPVPFQPVSLTWGTFGVFGYLGSGMDRSTSLVTNRKNMVQVVTASKKIVFSCMGFDRFKILS